MKRLTAWVAAGLICTTATAQDEAGKTSPKPDTIRIGGMIIVKKGASKKVTEVSMGHGTQHNKKSMISTNWGVVDLGFSRFNDLTNYNLAGNYLVNQTGTTALGKNDFKLRGGKSVNMNIWFFMQKLSLYKQHFNLKYGLGLELNNYRYKSSVSYRESGQIPYSTPGALSKKPFIFRDSIAFFKNKLAADYLTVPLMLNYTSNPHNRKRSFNMSLGVSFGYLYSQRNKQKSSTRGKWTNKGYYDMERFKFAYQGEIGFGSLHFYGSYSPRSMYKYGLDMQPYTFGLRFQ